MSWNVPGSLGPYRIVNGAGEVFDVVFSLLVERTYQATPPWGGAAEECRVAGWDQEIRQNDQVYNLMLAAYWNTATPEAVVLPALDHLAKAAATYFTGPRGPRGVVLATPVIWPLSQQVVDEVMNNATVLTRLPAACTALGLPSNTEMLAVASFAKWHPAYFV